MKKSILNFGKALNKEQQKTVNGGATLNFCAYHCNGTSYVLNSGSSTWCRLNAPSIIRNHPNCGGSGGGGEVWA